MIFQLQSGRILNQPHSRSMNTVESGVNELRVRDASGAYRVFYYIKTRKSILIFHAFKKKTQKTPKKEINLAKKNLKELLDE